MRILFEIVHPANVLFFLRPIRRVMERGDQILIVSRHKDVAGQLLDSLHLQHVPLSSAGRGVLGLGTELITRDLRLLRVARKFRPQVMIGYGGVAISHVGKVLGIPAISFYDTEVATLQTSITWPFITHLYVPASYRGRGPDGRMSRVPGTKELSYFHPSAFRPDRDVATRAGYEHGRENYFIRVVSWRANHDIGKQGWSEETLSNLVRFLAARGRVHISSERDIPPELLQYRYEASPSDVHHLLAHCRLYIGESATMACEAAMLGTQSVYASDDFRGYIDELNDAGLVIKVPTENMFSITDIVGRLLAEPHEVFLRNRAAYLQDKPDWADAVVAAIDRHARSTA